MRPARRTYRQDAQTASLPPQVYQSSAHRWITQGSLGPIHERATLGQVRQFRRPIPAVYQHHILRMRQPLYCVRKRHEVAMVSPLHLQVAAAVAGKAERQEARQQEKCEPPTRAISFQQAERAEAERTDEKYAVGIRVIVVDCMQVREGHWNGQVESQTSQGFSAPPP